MQEKSLYDILGVSKDASLLEVKVAYRLLSKKFHPDVNDGSKESEEKFKKISEAYEVLSSKERRKDYDETGTINKGDFDSRFGSFMDKVIMPLILSQSNIENIDMIQEMKEAMVKIREIVKKEYDSVQEESEKMIDFNKRLKLKEGSNPILFKHTNIRSIKIAMKLVEAEKDFKFIDKCEEVISGYEFEHNKQDWLI